MITFRISQVGKFRNPEARISITKGLSQRQTAAAVYQVAAQVSLALEACKCDAALCVDADGERLWLEYAEGKGLGYVTASEMLDRAIRAAGCQAWRE